MRRIPPILLALAALSGLSAPGLWAAGPEPRVLVVIGAEGAEEYLPRFQKAASLWKDAALAAGATHETIGMEPATGDETDRERLEKRLGELAAEEKAGPLWLVLIGHGTFDGRAAKFNLRGPDFTDAELAGWLRGFPGRVAAINTASASGTFVKALSGPDRVVVTATKSPAEVNYARFGEFFAEAIHGKAEADLDNDDQVSLLEAYLFAADRVRGFYEKEGRLATEHAQLDDTGDGFGTRPEGFEGVLAWELAREGAEPDGELAHQFILVPNAFERRLTAAQRERRDTLEREVKALNRRRAELGDDAYYDQVEPLLVEIAKIYDTVKDPGPAPTAPPAEGKPAETKTP
ncbi:MAG: hypothetical protein JNK37_07120 [Verrucomicrobiales bacterium]|nr:hypothetical protein [Verrucomicrobiales bacterium]